MILDVVGGLWDSCALKPALAPANAVERFCLSRRLCSVRGHLIALPTVYMAFVARCAANAHSTLARNGHALQAARGVFLYPKHQNGKGTLAPRFQTQCQRSSTSHMIPCPHCIAAGTAFPGTRFVRWKNHNSLLLQKYHRAPRNAHAEGVSSVPCS